MKTRQGSVVVVVLAVTALVCSVLLSMWRQTSMMVETARVRKMSIDLERVTHDEWLLAAGEVARFSSEPIKVARTALGKHVGERAKPLGKSWKLSGRLTSKSKKKRRLDVDVTAPWNHSCSVRAFITSTSVPGRHDRCVVSHYTLSHSDSPELHQS